MKLYNKSPYDTHVNYTTFTYKNLGFIQLDTPT